MEHAVAARALRKRFGALLAVDGVSFAIERGECFGFLGPNGAGKTTTMRMIVRSSPVDEGELTVLGMDAASGRYDRAIKRRIGVVPQEDNLDMELTVAENLYIYGRYFDLPRRVIRRRIDELLDFAQLAERRDARVESLSGGMKRRLTIARGLMNDPELVLLDEPTTGLDPQARHALWDRLYRLKRRGVTLIITTHYMDEAEQLCDRLVVMDRGRIVAEGSPRDLIARYSTPEVVELRFRPEVDVGAPSRFADMAQRVEILPDRVLLYTGDADATVAKVEPMEELLDGFLVRRATLEDVFLHLTGRSLVD